MKRVGLLLPTIKSGGAERVATRLSKLLSDTYEIYMILFEDTYQTYEFSGRLINLDIKAETGNKFKQLFLPVKRAVKLKQVKEVYKLDVVISFMDSPNIVNLLAKHPTCKAIVSVRNYDYKENSKLFDIAEKLLLKNADYVIPVSKVIKEVIGKRYGIAKDKIKEIYNPYSIDEIDKFTTEELDADIKNFMSDKFCFVTAGRHSYQKGFWHLLKAFNLANKKHQDIGLIILGRDAEQTPIFELIDMLGLSDKVKVVGYSDNPFKYIRHSDVYVLSSLFEGFPNSLVEAMACGCPVIAADCKSGPREILCRNADITKICNDIELGEYGILVKPMEMNESWESLTVTESETELSKAMQMMFENSLMRLTYAKKARERAMDFSYARCKGEYISVINSVISK